MTSEVAILNKEAIALAADSAVTLSKESGEKIFTSANKIFMLSKYCPLGILIYGNADFMGIPWEKLIKIYRKKLDTTVYDRLENYADHFIDFLKSDAKDLLTIQIKILILELLFIHILLILQKNSTKFMRKNSYLKMNYLRKK